MTKGEESKRHIVECAAKLFWQKGYTATGISDIVAASGLPKGSFYFYFRSKRDVAAAAVDYYEGVVTDWLRGLAEGSTWEQFVTGLTQSMGKLALEGKHLGCPFAVMGMEVAFIEPGIADGYLRSLEQLQSLFEDVLLRSGVRTDDAAALARRMFAVYEGELLTYRIGRDTATFQRLRDDLLGMYRDYRALHGPKPDA